VFVDFINVTEDVLKHISRVKSAIENAGIGIVAEEVASWDSSMSKVQYRQAAASANKFQGKIKSMTTSFDASQV